MAIAPAGSMVSSTEFGVLLIELALSFGVVVGFLKGNLPDLLRRGLSVSAVIMHFD